MTARVTWQPSFRLIDARLPVIDIFETIAPGELEAVLAIEALTNPRLTPTLGPIQNIPLADRVTGPGASFVMAPFVYLCSKRFSDNSAGAYSAANDLNTAVAEIIHHRNIFLATTNTPPMDVDERIVEADIDANVTDIRCEALESPLYNKSDYRDSQRFAQRQRSAASHGIVYRSVRRPEGQCIAIFIPRLIRNARTTGYIGLRWNGTHITDSYKKVGLLTQYPDEA